MKIGKVRRWLIRKLGGVPRDEIPIPSIDLFNKPFEPLEVEVKHVYCDTVPFAYKEEIPIESIRDPLVLKQAEKIAGRKLGEFLFDEGLIEKITNLLTDKPYIIFRAEFIKPTRKEFENADIY